MSKIEVNTVAPQCGTTLTLGESGDTVVLATGASQSGFGRSGSVNWQTTPKTSTFTAVNGEGYFINSGSSLTMNLPAGSAGAIVAVSDYARNFATYNLLITPNGSEKIGGTAANLRLNVDGQATTLVYVDSTKGWINVQNAEDTQTGIVPAYVTASGGTVSTIGDFKYHKFTGPGTFTVSCAGNSGGSNTVQALVIGGGGGGTYNGGGGGGAGGLRNLACQSVTATGFPITVGSGGAKTSPGTPTPSPGNNSVFSTITAAGGGAGGPPGGGTGSNGGSGGGAGGNGGNAGTGGTGNTPPVSPPQGNPGGSHGPQPNYNAGSGGGGHTSAGSAPPAPGTPGSQGGAGGNGTDVSPSFPAPLGGSPAGFYAGGGGGGGNDDGPGNSSATPSAPGGGGSGGGGPGGVAGGNGTCNTGGGAGGSPTNGGPGSGIGGSGIVIIKYKFQN